MSVPEWFLKHPCVKCRAGYAECISLWKVNMQCCSVCDHPGRWNTNPPYTTEEIEAMTQASSENRN